MRSTLKAGLIALATGALLVAPLSAASAGERDRDDRGRPLQVVGLVGGTSLVDFRTNNTRTGKARTITGLAGDTSLVGIDHRVQDGKLYGVGNSGGLYTLDDRGRASKVGQLTVALDGKFFAVDFNPAANALRILSDTGQNLRQPFATAGAPTVADTPLTNPAVAPATGTVPAPGVTAAGYTNNDLDAGTATTLFDLDTVANRVAVQSPANAGTLAPTGNLPADIGPDAGLDVYSTLDDGVTTTNTAYAVVTVDGKQRFWKVDLLSGDATDLGELKGVTDVSLPLDQD